MNINQDVLDGRVKRVCGGARERRGRRARDYREMALGQLEYTAGVLQERRGRLTDRLQRVSARLGTSVPQTGPRS
jgi:uncharacterized protein YjbJ (UPF0337 family)